MTLPLIKPSLCHTTDFIVKVTENLFLSNGTNFYFQKINFSNLCRKLCDSKEIT